MFSPAEEGTVTIRVDFAEPAHGICWCDPGGNHLNPEGSSPGNKGCWKEEAQQELITRFTACFSSRSWGSRTGSLICSENYLWVGFWQAGFEVCSAIPTSSVLAAIPHWNSEVNHCCGQWLMHSTSCAPAPELLESASYPGLLLRAELAQHPLNRAALQMLGSAFWVYCWGHRKLFLVCSYVCGAFLMSWSLLQWKCWDNSSTRCKRLKMCSCLAPRGWKVTLFRIMLINTQFQRGETR